MTAPSDTPDAPDVVPGGPAIEANDLTYRYAKRDEPALAGLTLTLRPGTITGLLGRNGSGKTTLLSLAAGLRRPTAGRLTVAGRPAFDDATTARAVACLGGPRCLIEDVPIRRSLELWAVTRPGWDAQEAARLMEVFEVPLRTRPSRLSLGQRSALEAVVALACHCPVLLLDEIHLGMDVVVRRRFWDELLALYLRERPTVVVSSHQVDEIEDLLEDVVVLHHGRLAAAGTADELRAAHSRPGRGLASLADALIDLTSGTALASGTDLADSTEGELS